MQPKITIFLDKDNTVGKLYKVVVEYRCFDVHPTKATIQLVSSVLWAVLLHAQKPEGESMNTRFCNVSFHYPVMDFSKQLYVATVTRF